MTHAWGLRVWLTWWEQALVAVGLANDRPNCPRAIRWWYGSSQTFGPPLRFYPIKRHVVVTGRPNRVGKPSWLVRCNPSPSISRHPTPTFIFLIFLGDSSLPTQHSDFYKRDFVEQNGGIGSYAILISSRTKSWCLSPAEGRPVASTEAACVVACWCQTKARNQWSWNPSFRL